MRALIVFRPRSSDDTLASLVNELKGPMSAQSQNLKICIAEGLVPAANLVKQAHRHIDQVDVTFGNGVLTFNQSCKTMERVMVNGRNAIVAAYMKLRVRSPPFPEDDRHIIISR
jgi:hypothetical protein